jgi:hypothetical protein
MRPKSRDKKPSPWLPFHEVLEKIQREQRDELIARIRDSKPVKRMSMKEANELLEDKQPPRVSKRTWDRIPEFEDGSPNPSWFTRP